MIYHASLSVGKSKYHRHLSKMIYHEIITKNCKKCMREFDISKMIAKIDIMIFCNIAPHSENPDTIYTINKEARSGFQRKFFSKCQIAR